MDDKTPDRVDYSKPRPPPPPLTPSERAQVQLLARQMAVICLGPKEYRVDHLAGILAHRAEQYGRQD